MKIPSWLCVPELKDSNHSGLSSGWEDKDQTGALGHPKKVRKDSEEVQMAHRSETAWKAKSQAAPGQATVPTASKAQEGLRIGILP